MNMDQASQKYRGKARLNTGKSLFDRLADGDGVDSALVSQGLRESMLWQIRE